MSELIRILMQLYAQWRRVQFLRGLARTVGVATLLIILACELDYFVELPMVLRLALTTLVYGGTAVYAGVFWLNPTFRPRSLEQIAWLVEETCPQLKERLISAIELRDNRSAAVSDCMIGKLVEDAREAIGQIRGREAFPLQLRSFRFSLVVTGLFLGAMAIPQLKLPRLFLRVTVPSINQGGIGSFSLYVQNPIVDEYIEGDSVFFSISTDNPELREVSLFLMDKEERIQRERIIRDPRSGDFTYTLRGVYDDLRFWAKADKVSTSVRRISVTKRPKIEFFQVRYKPQAYTGLPEVTFHSTSGDLKGLVNTEVDLLLRASKALSAVELRLNDELLPVTLSPDRRTGRCRLTIDKSTTYSVTLKDENGLGSSGGMNYEITMLPDQAPRAVLLQPENDLYVTESSVIRLEWETSDDFGIAKQELHCQRSSNRHQYIRLPDNVSEYEFELDVLRLSEGEELKLQIAVTDAIGQVAESEARTLTIVNSRDLTGASAFRSRIRELNQEIGVAEARLGEIASSIGNIILGQKTSVEKSADLGHNLIMLNHRIRRLDQQLQTLLVHLSKLSEYAFFTDCHLALDVIRQSIIRQIAWGSYHNLENMEALEDGQKDCEKVLIFSRDLIRELDQQAIHIITNTLGELILSNLAAAEKLPLSDPNRLEVVERARSKALALSRLHNSSEARVLRIGVGRRRRVPLQKLKRRFQIFHGYNQVAMEKKGAIAGLIAKLTTSRIPFNNKLYRFAEQLELNNKKEDWEAVARLGNAYGVLPSPRTEELEDWQLVSSLFRKSADNKSSKQFQLAARAVPRMQDYHACIRLQPILSERSILLDQASAEAIELLSSPKGLSSAATMRFEALLARRNADIDMLLAFPFAQRRIADLPSMRPVGDALKESKRRLKILEQQFRMRNYAESKITLTAAVNSLRKGVDRMFDVSDDAQSRRDLARKALLKQIDPPSRRIVALIGQLKAFERELHSQQPEDVIKLEQLIHELSKIANRMNRQAFASISRPDGSVSEARQRMAMAGEIMGICQEQLKGASAIIIKTEEQTEDQRMRTLLDARENLLSAIQALQDLTQLLIATEAWERGEISLRQKRRNDRDLALFAEKWIERDVRRLLALLKTVREERSQIGQLVVESRQLYKDSAFRHRLQNIAQESRIRLVLSLQAENADAFWESARKQVRHASVRCERFLSALRQARSLVLGSTAGGERSKIAKDLQISAQSLHRSLERVEGFRQIYRLNRPVALDLVSTKLLPLLSKLGTKDSGEFARSIVESIAGTKQLQKVLLAYMVELDTVRYHHDQNETAVDYRSAIEALFEKFDRMKQTVALPEAAQAVASEIDSRLKANKKEARKILGEIPMDHFVNPELRDHVRRQIDRFDDSAIVQKVGILRDIANRLKDHEDMKAALLRSAELMGKDKRWQYRRNQLARHARLNAEYATRHAEKMVGIWASFPDRELAAASTRLVRDYQDNMRLGDYEAARMNLAALKRNIEDIAHKPSLPVEETKKAEVTEKHELEGVALQDFENLDWHSKRGVMILLASEKKQLRNMEKRALRIAERGDFATAARMSRGLASLAFSRAARIHQALPDNVPPAPKEFRLSAQLAPVDGGVPMNEEAFDATSVALLLGNQVAVDYAYRGDYRRAAWQMLQYAELSEVIPIRDLAIRSRNRFLEAAEVQLEALPHDLATTIREFEAEIDKHQPKQRAFVESMLLATRAQNWGSALKQAQALRKNLENQDLTRLRRLSNAAEKAEESARRRLKSLPAEVRRIAGTMEQLVENVGRVPNQVLPLMDLAMARKAIGEREYGTAVFHLGIAALQLQDESHNQATQVLIELRRLEEVNYGDVNPYAREGIRLTDSKRITALARVHDYQQAAALASKAGDPLAAQAFKEAAELELDRLGPTVEAARGLLQKAEAKADNDGKKQLRVALTFLQRGALENACKAAEPLLTRQLARLDIIELVRSCREHEEKQVSALRAAQKLVRANRYDAAARFASGSKYGAQAARVMRKAEQLTDQGIQLSLNAAFRQESHGARRALEDAAHQAARNNLSSAVARARAVKASGKAACAKFEEATRLAAQADDLLTKEIARASKEDSTEQLRKAVTYEQFVAKGIDKKRFQTLLEALEERNYKRALEMAIATSQGAYETQQAVNMLEMRMRAIMKEKALESTPLAQLRSVPRSYQLNLARTVADLRMKKKTPQVEDLTDSFKAASKELEVANGLITEQIVRLLLKDQGEQEEEKDESMELSREAKAWLERFEQDPTKLGTNINLHGSFLTGRKQDYEAYYREANKKYLRWIAREGKRWKAGEQE